MKCYVCESEDWFIKKDLNPKKEVGICKNCGNIAFLLKDNDEKKLDEFYKFGYRTTPNSGNLITTTRKLGYIKIFLKDYLKDKKDLICGDIGAATGYLCNFLRSIGNKATGSEKTLLFRRFSEYYYGIPLTEELESKHKYDLISYYHVLEHLCYPDKKLLKYRELLKDDGIMFISVPEWLYELTDLSAYNKLSIENYFHENHLNCFTNQSFKNLMNKCGLEIIKEDHEQYGITVLVKKCEPKEIIKEDWKLINEKINRIKNAIDLFHQNKLKEALDLWNLFPDAQMRLIYDVYRKDENRQAEEFKRILEKYPFNVAYRVGRAVWHYQFSRYEESMMDFEWALKIKPHEDYMMYIGWCLDRLNKPHDALKYFDQAQTINPTKWNECTNWICSICSKMPAWDERARMEIEKKAFELNKDKIKLIDPSMEEKKEETKKEEKPKEIEIVEPTKA
jgi:tetratricopeptide (TPR) repeat protein